MLKFKSIMMPVVTALAVVGLTACASGPAPTGAPVPKQAASQPVAKPAWEQDWDRTVTAARAEGRVTFYSTYGPGWRQAFSEAMAKKYSVTMDFISGTSEEVISRLVREQQSKIYTGDATMASTTYIQLFQREGVLQPLEKHLVLPEVVDPKSWWRGQLTWLDPERKTLLAFRDALAPPMVINTDLVKPGELKSWDDIQDPRWKGKIVMMDPTMGGAGQQTMLWLGYAIKNWDFVRALVRQEPFVLRDYRLMTEWVARGKYPILVGPFKEPVFQFKKEGAPLNYFTPSEGTYSDVGGGVIGFVKNSQNPNATKVFINFLLSREGQTLSAKSDGFQSARVDVPTDSLDPDTVRQPGMKYYSTVDKDFLEKLPELRKTVQAIFQDYKNK